MRYLFKGAFYCCSALIYIYINITGERENIEIRRETFK